MTYEEYLVAINKRCSRRKFKAIALSDSVAEVISQMVASVNKHSGLEFTFVKDGEKPFTFITGKFSYITIVGEDNVKVREDCGYYGEMIVLQCVFHGLGTCWVTGTYNENAIYEQVSVPKGKRLYGVIVVGNVNPKKSLKENMIYNATHKKGKPYQKMFSYCDKKLPQFYVSAMEAVEKAPSGVNLRPVNFRFENGEISVSVEEPFSAKSLDLGIAKFHFEIGCAVAGVAGKFNHENIFVLKGNNKKVIKFPESERVEEIDE